MLNPPAGLQIDIIATAAASNEIITAIEAVRDEVEAAVVGLAVGAAVGVAEGAAVGTAVGAAVTMPYQMLPPETVAARLTPSCDMAIAVQYLVAPGLEVFSVQVAPPSLELHVLPL